MVDARSSWIVLNTHPNKENLALINLARQEFAAYCPVVRKRVRHARRVQQVLRPLFPGYVFVETPAAGKSWRPLLSTFGVRTLVRTGDEPSRLDAGFIAALRARENEGVIVAPSQPYAVGQEVRITDGPFDGLAAKVIDLDEKDRVIVLLDLLKRSVRVHLEAHQIAAA